MRTRKEILMDSITPRILILFATNRSMSGQNKNNGALSAEDYLLNILNIIRRDMGQKYINTKELGKNTFEGIDLYDKKNKIGIQVTVERSKKKIDHTFTQIMKDTFEIDVSRVEFFIQADDYPSGHAKYMPEHEGYKVSIYSVFDLLKEIERITDNVILEEVGLYIEENTILPENFSHSQDPDQKIFRMLFLALTKRVNDIENQGAAAAQNTENNEYVSDLLLKKQKYQESWDSIENMYKAALGLKNEGNVLILSEYSRAVSDAFTYDLSEDQRIGIETYLLTQSIVCLRKSEDDPVMAINALANEIRNDLDIKFIPKSNIISFLLNMFLKCDIFPISYGHTK